MVTQGLLTNLSETHMISQGEVQATGPLGILTAGQMELWETDDARYLIVFNKGVKLIYTP